MKYLGKLREMGKKTVNFYNSTEKNSKIIDIISLKVRKVEYYENLRKANDFGAF